jgi:cytochrome c oxidase subunit 2
MGKALGLLIWIITGAAVVLFVGKWWWFPPVISDHGIRMDAQFDRTLIVVGIAFTAAQVALGYFVFRYTSSRKGEAVYTHGSSKLEATWTIITAVVFVSLSLLGQKVWAELHFRDAPPDAINIEVTSQQFAWNFRYPGPDGQFGRTNPRLVDDSAGNPLGIDDTDPASRDDIVTSTLTIPVNKPVRLTLRSKDVIHSFFVPVLRLKQDAVPGMAVNIHFVANHTGRYEVACAELCGLGHYKMKTFVDVVSEEDFNKFLIEKAANR